ncbi:twin-arginine translocation signal domain-containing protein, partial [Micromonospora zhanjiangensis]
MGHLHDHGHHHGQDHGHGHDHADADHGHGEVRPVLDPTIPDSELSPADVSRRGFLRGAGLLGAGTAAAAAGGFAVPEVAMAHDDA